MHEHGLPLRCNRLAATSLHSTRSLHDALPIFCLDSGWRTELHARWRSAGLSVIRLQSTTLGMRLVEFHRPHSPFGRMVFCYTPVDHETTCRGRLEASGYGHRMQSVALANVDICGRCIESLSAANAVHTVDR